MAGREIDFQRLVVDHQKNVRNLATWAKKARQSYAAMFSADNPVVFLAIDELVTSEMSGGLLSRLNTLNNLLYLLEEDPLQSVTVPGPFRRPRRGKRPEPWLASARQALRRAGVPQDHEDELLIVVGLIPYRLAV